MRLPQREVCAGQVHPRQHLAQLLDVRQPRRQHGLPGQPVDQRRRSAAQLVQDLPTGIGLWLGQALDGTVLPYALGIGFWSVVTTTVAWTLVQRHTR